MLFLDPPEKMEDRYVKRVKILFPLTSVFTCLLDPKRCSDNIGVNSDPVCSNELRERGIVTVSLFCPKRDEILRGWGEEKKEDTCFVLSVLSLPSAHSF